MVTATQLAEVLGTTRQTIARAAEDGRLTVAKRDGRGRPQFDTEVAIKEWAAGSGAFEYQKHQSEGKSKGGRPSKKQDAAAPPPEVLTTFDVPVLEGQDLSVLLNKLSTLTPAQQLVQVDVIKKLRDARRAELHVLKEEGTLIAIEIVRDQGVELGTVLMGALNALPARLSPQLAVMNDAHDIHEKLVTEINQMITSIRKRCGVTDDEEADPNGDVSW